MSPKSWSVGKAFTEKYKHHESIKALWETKWRFPCEQGTYPFQEGRLEDFQKVFDHLIKNDIDDGYSDAYTEAFFPLCDDLVRQAEAIQAIDPAEASSLNLRAACLYRIARFPYISSPLKRKAWELQKNVFLRGSSSWESPVYDELIPHTSGSELDGKEIPAYVRLPTGASEQKPAPTVLVLTGLDRHRPDCTNLTDEFIARGWASVMVEIPGTGDCPADRKDPESPDRLWDSVLDWMAPKKVFDMDNVVAWGLSTGGFYGVRIAHTHKERLRGAVGQGAGVHHWFDPEWLEHTDDHEYPFQSSALNISRINKAMSQKFGYETVAEFKQKAQQKFSLVSTGVVNKPSTRLLLVNGTLDGLMPIEDSQLLMEYGTPKEGRFITGRGHMGYPEALTHTVSWLEMVINKS